MPVNQLKNYLRDLTGGGIALAFSGGVDSTLLLAVLGELRQEKDFPLVALTMQTVLQDKAEIREADKLTKKLNIPQQIFSFNPFSLTAVQHNQTDRCYHCKKAIFIQFAAFAAAHRLQYLLDGTNADDLKVYRPGRKALKELGVISPLAELGITKQQIREMSAALSLPTAAKPAVPCLATRFDYDTLLTEEQINRVAQGEALLRQKFPHIKDIRLRVQDDTARLEVSKPDLAVVVAQADDICAALKSLEFHFITLDLEGFRSGSFDRKLKQD